MFGKGGGGGANLVLASLGRAEEPSQRAQRGWATPAGWLKVRANPSGSRACIVQEDPISRAVQGLSFWRPAVSSRGGRGRRGKKRQDKANSEDRGAAGGRKGKAH